MILKTVVLTVGQRCAFAQPTKLLKKRQLRQVYVEANGHCTLTQAEWTVALEAMERRLDTGVWPGAGFFPSIDNPIYDQRLHFNNTFNPGLYPQPPSP